ncbi:OsmC family protein [Haliscomenobacter sp.]|uniref:OsmC family protein n=1 Tax=Haliscomenobacter sp. TaxID=2717303 RepID=UPI0035936D03
MQYLATVIWKKLNDAPFHDGKYSRSHTWSFDGGLSIPASSSPQVVAVPMSDEAAIDPEEALVAAVSSCHMLFFLSIAASKKLIVNRYEDRAEGKMGKNEMGKTAMLDIFLRPAISWGGNAIPNASTIDEMHEEAHQRCFIANSLKTKINIITK